MRHDRVVTSVACVVVLAMASTAFAQERKGFWGTFGVGVGSFEVSASPAQGSRFTDRDGGGVSELALGWAVNRRLLAGFELKTGNGTVGSEDSVGVNVYSATGALWFYPTASNFFVKGGVGQSIIEGNSRLAGSTITESHGGIGLTAGAGYDLYLGRGFSLTPAAGFWYGRPGELRLGGTTLLEDFTQNVVDFTVAIKFN